MWKSINNEQIPHLEYTREGIEIKIRTESVGNVQGTSMNLHQAWRIIDLSDDTSKG